MVFYGESNVGEGIQHSFYHDEGISQSDIPLRTAGHVDDISRPEKLKYEEVKEALMRVKGIGTWTVEDQGHFSA